MTSPRQDAADWMHRPERSNRSMLRMMSWISLRLGRNAARVVLRLIAGYFLLFAPASRAGSRRYLGRILPHPVRWSDIYRHFFCFAATIHDRVYLLNQRFDLFDIEIQGEALVRQLMAGGRGAFLLGAHMGSFEVIRAFGRCHTDLEVSMAMYEDNARKINQMLAAINPAAQQDVIALGRIDSMLKISEALDRGGLVGMLADRTLDQDAAQATLTTPLLGSLARLPLGPFRMAAILHRPVIFMTGLYLGKNRYQIHFEALADFSKVPRAQRQAAVEWAVARYAVLLEKYCRQAPYNWFNFFDFWRSASATAKETDQ